MPEDTKNKERKSPVGYPELLGITPSGILAKTMYDIDKNHTPLTVYNRDSWDDPETQAHERLHQGQLAIKAAANVQQVKQALLSGIQPTGRTELSLQHTNDPLEMPAYLFESFDKNNQQAYNNYMNLLQRTNPKNVESVGASSLPEYQRGYFNSGVQAPEIPELAKLSAWQILKQSLGGK